MKKVFPVKLLDAARFPFPASQCFSIIKERLFKERFFTFKAEERLLKDTDSFCAGTKSVKAAKDAVKHVVEDLKNVGIEITKKPKIVVQNMVASGSVGGKLNLNEIVFLFDNTEYEPEQFPGLVYKLKGEDQLQNITYLNI